MGPKSKDPIDPGVDLRIIQLSREGMVGTTGPQIHPHYHLSLLKWLNAATDKNPQEVHAREPIL
jgi:hypothetical protein